MNGFLAYDDIQSLFWHYEAAEDWLESTEAEQLSPEEIVKVASEIGKIIVAQDAWWIQELKFTQFVICLFCGLSSFYTYITGLTTM